MSRRKRRVLPDKLRALVTFKRTRPLKPREIAQYAVNIVRRYPDFHDQGVDVDCGNKACLVGWCESLIAGELPAGVARKSMARRMELLGGRRSDANEGFAEVNLVAKRLRVDPELLREQVYSENDAEIAIENFCDLTGAIDPGEITQGSSAA